MFWGKGEREDKKEKPLQILSSRAVIAGSTLNEQGRRVYKRVEEDRVYSGTNQSGNFVEGVVADGASKSDRPDFMATLLVNEVYKLKEPTLAGLRGAVNKAHAEAVKGAAGRESASTVTAVVIPPKEDSERRKAVVLHIGDSRVYLLRQRGLYQLTNDHDEFHDRVRQLLSAGKTLQQAWDQAKAEGKKKNQITRAVSTAMNRPSTADSFEVELVRGDVLLLCSDGLDKCIPDRKELAIELGASLETDNPAITLASKAEKKAVAENKRRIDDIGVAIVRLV